MNQTAINYGKVLFLLGVDRQIVAEAADIWEESEPLREAMESPVVGAGEKHRLIERIFPSLPAKAQTPPIYLPPLLRSAGLRPIEIIPFHN